jgi:hypothetical protein
MSRNPLAYVSDQARVAAYVIYSIIALGVGAAQVAYASIEAAQPDWLTVALAVLAFLGSALGFTAATHTSRDPRIEELGPFSSRAERREAERLVREER